MVDHSEALDFPTQTDEQRKAILSGVLSGDGSAAGKERGRLFDETDKNIPQGDDQGSKVPIVGGDQIKPDSEGPQQPFGNQAKPAIMTPSGSLPLGMVATPGGPVPVGVVATDHKQANEILQKQLDSHAGRGTVHEGFARIPRSQIEQSSSASLRAAAKDRGWDIGEAGARVSRARFIQKQNEEYGGDPDDPNQKEGEGAVDADLSSPDHNVAMAAAAPEGYTWDAASSRYILISG